MSLQFNLMKKEIGKKWKLSVQVKLKQNDKYHFVTALSNVFFPYQPYPQQVDIVRSIQKAIKNNENALIQSPTGTGKTLCLLIGALSTLVDASYRAKIYYLTRTHSQISQVVSQLKKTNYFCNVNIIASREHFCINHNLSKLKGKLLQKACEDLCFQKLCPYKELSTSRRPREVLDLHQFKDFCKKQLTCPYFFSKQLTQKCQLTILPFNYLLDWSLFERSSLDLKDAVIIFDEAHNIDSLCEQGSDVRLPFDVIVQAIAELKVLIKAQNSKTLHPQFTDKFQERQQVIELKLQLELLVNKIKSTGLEVISRHDILGRLQEFTTTANQLGVDLGNYRQFVGRGRKIAKLFYKKQIQCQSLLNFMIIFQKMYGILGNSQTFQKFSIALSKTELLFRCLDPSLCFLRLADCKPRSLLLSSGTLGDLDLWQKNLKIPFINKIATESFVTQHHLYAQVVPKSKNGHPFNFNFQGKQNEEQFQQVSFLLSSLEGIIQGGIVVAFSTYELLERTLKYCSGLKKKVYFETKGGSIDDIYSNYQSQVSKDTSFLFIVIRGRFSEGINFTGELCRCLIVVGIPFLPLKDPGVVQKMRYLQSNCSRKQAEEWYTMQSFKSLNQTLGRAIRNKEDYAVILLIDQRYTREQYVNHLSKWFLNCLRPGKNGLDDISYFLKGAAEPKQESKAKTSSKAKKQLTICERLAQFSTPNKSLKPKKLKLVLESEKEAQERTVLKEIKIVEELNYYKPVSKQFQEYFMTLGSEEETTLKKTKTTFSECAEQQSEKTSVNMIKMMQSYKKCRDNLEF